MRIKNQVGDTIIEVILALAVLGSVIVGGYSIATRSLNGVRISQERGEALKIAETQAEIIRQFFDTSVITGDSAQSVFKLEEPNPYIAINNTWPATVTSLLGEYGICFDITDNMPRKINLTLAQKDDIGNPEYLNCIFDGRYQVYITTDLHYTKSGGTLEPSTATFTYKIYVTWERSGGGSLETLNLNYRDSF